jgi:hypothetical protein
MRRERVPELCWPARLGADFGWLIPSPVHIRMTPIDDIEIAGGDEQQAQAFAATTGYDSLWPRGGNYIAVRNAGWIREADVRSDRGFESMFVPNGQGSLEWHLGWNVEIPDGHFLFVFGLSSLPELEIPAGVLDSSTLQRLNGTTGMALAIRPRAPVEIVRGQPVARMIVLHPDSLQMKMITEDAPCHADPSTTSS